MTPDETLALYRPIRASIRRLLGVAVRACNQADVMRAGKQLGLWSDGGLVLPEGDEAIEMLSDIALFEPNQRGRRAFDRFLSEQAGQLDMRDLALAKRMGGAIFSLFRCAGRHDAGGLWLQDLLAGDRPLWLMDEALAETVAEGAIIGMRLFEAEPFHAGFGIVVQSDEETIQMCVQTKASTGRLPFRHSLAATLYDDALLARLPHGPEEEQMLRLLLESLAGRADNKKREKAPAGRDRQPFPNRCDAPPASRWRRR